MSDGTLRVIHSEPGDTELRVTHKLEAKFGHFLIGRHRKADLEIDNNIISRKHVVIKLEGKIWFVINHGLNEVKINGDVIPKYPEQYPLKNDDTIAIGPNDEFVFKVDLPSGSGRDGESSVRKASSSDVAIDDFRDNLKKLEDKMSRIRQRRDEAERNLRVQETFRESAIKKILKEKNRDRRALEYKEAETEYHKRYRLEYSELKHAKEDLNFQEKRYSELKSEWDAARRDLSKAERAAAKAAKAAQEKLKVVEAQAAQERELTRKAKTEMTERLASKDTEIANLRKELDEMCRKRQGEDSPTSAAVKRAKNDQFTKLSEELTCSVCNEVFIKTMALECGHKFCQYCIERWQSRAPGGELNCPNCRKKVTAFHPDITVDNLIESLFRDLSDQQQKDRRDTIEERQKDLEELRRNPIPAAADSTSELSELPIIVESEDGYDSPHTRDSRTSDFETSVVSDLDDPGSLSPRNWSDAGSGSHYSNTGSGPLSDNDLDSGSEASGPVVESNHGDDSTHTYNTASDVDGYSAVENNHSGSNNNDSDESQDSPSYGESGEEQQDSNSESDADDDSTNDYEGPYEPEHYDQENDDSQDYGDQQTDETQSSDYESQRGVNDYDERSGSSSETQWTSDSG